MADLVNKAVKTGKYFDTEEDQVDTDGSIQTDKDWHTNFVEQYEKLRSVEK